MPKQITAYIQILMTDIWMWKWNICFYSLYQNSSLSCTIYAVVTLDGCSDNHICPHSIIVCLDARDCCNDMVFDMFFSQTVAAQLV